MAPQHAKALGALHENIKKFESKHGEINLPKRQDDFLLLVKPPKIHYPIRIFKITSSYLKRTQSLPFLISFNFTFPHRIKHNDEINSL